MNVSSCTSGFGGIKFCGGASCDFSDSKTSSKDAKEKSASMRKLLMAVTLCVIFMAVKVVGGIKVNSVAILTDAAHLLSDVAAFAISLFSLWASGWEATPRKSYGFFRIEILGALVSVQLIWLFAGILVYQAIVRIIHDNGEVQGSLMFAVSAFGLVVNIIMAVMLGHDHGHGGHSHGRGKSDHDHSHHHDDHDHEHTITVTTHNHHNNPHPEGEKHEHETPEPLLSGSTSDESKQKKRQRNINVHSAYLHVLGDSIQSTGVMIDGAIIWYVQARMEDNLEDNRSYMHSHLLSYCTSDHDQDAEEHTREVLRESTPREIDATRLEAVQDLGCGGIHELHIWAITVGKVLLACHVTITPEFDADQVLDKVIGYIEKEYNISHQFNLSAK